MKTEDGRLVVVGGASRSGKTAYVRMRTAGAVRVIAWDPEDQWAQIRGWRRVTTRAALLEAVQGRGPAKIAYVAGGDLVREFGYWCECVMYSGRYVEPCVAIAEELADVTTPGKAASGWGILLRRGLKRGITIYAISQRWAEADKTAMGNASEFVFFRTATVDDAVYLWKKTGIPASDLDGLLPLQYIRKDGITRKIEPVQKLRF